MDPAPPLSQIDFSPDASWDTVNSVLLGVARFVTAVDGWAMNVHLDDGRVSTALWLGTDDTEENARLRPWDEPAGDYSPGVDVTVPLASITRLVVL